MNQQIIINIGVSGSGKTTWSTEYIKNNPNTFRVNRDDIRKTLKGDLVDYYKQSGLELSSIEDLVSIIENNMIKTILLKRYNVIIDNTNLGSRYINNWIELTNNFVSPVDIKFKIFDEVDKEVLKQRIRHREGEFAYTEYIDKQLIQYKVISDYIKKTYPNQIL